MEENGKNGDLQLPWQLPSYVGGVHPNCDYFHGQIPYMKGAHLFQAARANRKRPDLDDMTGHTYKHAPDLAWYHGRFYIQYLTSPKDEHEPGGVSVLTSSEDGMYWRVLGISFPEYKIPACEVTDYKGLHHVFDGTTSAFMHQRMAFYCSSDGVMLLLGFYGWSPQLWMTNWDNYGIGRVVRRLYPDGTLGKIYFIKVNWQGGWKKENLLYPEFEENSDEEFVRACRELLANSLAVQQWAEENGDKDPAIKIKHPEGGTYQAFCWYHRDEDDVIGLWKHSYAARSPDGGKTWCMPQKAAGLVMSGQKIWGCRTSDGRFALVYDPTLETQHRFPMCIVTSDDGLEFDNMLLVHGEEPPIRYKGFCKDLGPQYMRGISEGLPRPGSDDLASDAALCREYVPNNDPKVLTSGAALCQKHIPEDNLYLAYSVNKEDIWFAKLAVPVRGKQDGAVCEKFFDENVLREWNLYKPYWADISTKNGALMLVDREPYDYVRAVRLLPASAQIRVEAEITVGELKENQCVQLELCDSKHTTAVRLIFRPSGHLDVRTVCELGMGRWEAGKAKHIIIEADCKHFCYTVCLDGKWSGGLDKRQEFKFMAAVNEISEFSLRTGEPRCLANIEENPDNKPQNPPEGCEEPAATIKAQLSLFKAEALPSG